MSDDRRGQAIDIVARDVIARLSDETEDVWDLYDEIGMDDWKAIESRIAELTPYPDRATYQAAYEFLARRSGDDNAL